MASGAAMFSCTPALRPADGVPEAEAVGPNASPARGVWAANAVFFASPAWGALVEGVVTARGAFAWITMPLRACSAPATASPSIPARRPPPALVGAVPLLVWVGTPPSAGGANRPANSASKPVTTPFADAPTGPTAFGFARMALAVAVVMALGRRWTASEWRAHAAPNYSAGQKQPLRQPSGGALSC